MSDVAPVARGSWQPRAAGRIRSIAHCHFDIVQGCQLRCVGCPNSTLQPPVKRISVADFDLCLGNIDVKAIGLLRLFNYGEPLLHRELPALLEVIPRQRWKAVEVEISTNAQFVDWPSFTAALATRILTRLVVSCDGDGTPEDYERLRPPSRWPRLVEFLEKAGDLRRRLHPDLDLVTRTICTDPAEQARWRALVEPLGWTPQFRSWLALPGSQEHMTGQPAAVPQGLCIFQTHHDVLYVSQDGTVVPCCAHPQAATLGNLKEQRFNAIMIGERRRAFIAAMAADRPAMAICGSCEWQ